jgi:hypothetical protein
VAQYHREHADHRDAYENEGRRRPDKQALPEADLFKPGVDGLSKA